MNQDCPSVNHIIFFKCPPTLNFYDIQPRARECATNSVDRLWLNMFFLFYSRSKYDFLSSSTFKNQIGKKMLLFTLE